MLACALDETGFWSELIVFFSNVQVDLLHNGNGEGDGETNEVEEETNGEDIADDGDIEDDEDEEVAVESDQYDTDSESSVCSDVDFRAFNDVGPPVAKETLFLIGGRSRYGRSIKLNNKWR